MQIKFRDWNGTRLESEQVDDMIRSAVRFLLESPEEKISYSMSGDTLVLVTNYDEIEVTISKVTQRGTEYVPEADPDIMYI